MSFNDDIDRDWQIRLEKSRLERAAHFRRLERERRNTFALMGVSILAVIASLIALIYIAK